MRVRSGRLERTVAVPVQYQSERIIGQEAERDFPDDAAQAAVQAWVEQQLHVQRVTLDRQEAAIRQAYGMVPVYPARLQHVDPSAKLAPAAAPPAPAPAAPKPTTKAPEPMVPHPAVVAGADVPPDLRGALHDEVRRFERLSRTTYAGRKAQDARDAAALLKEIRQTNEDLQARGTR